MMIEVPSTYIEAIKYYRECNRGASLKESSEAYSDFMFRLGYSRIEWHRLSLNQIRAYMEMCQAKNREPEFQAIEDSLKIFNLKYGTNYCIQLP